MKEVLTSVAGRAAVAAVMVMLLLAAAGAGAGIAGACARGSDELVLTLLEGGFDPAEATRPAGKLFLTVDNRSGAERITLRLAVEGGAHVRDMEVPPGSLDWGAEVELQAGHYVLTEVDHPQWVCRISIE